MSPKVIIRPILESDYEEINDLQTEFNMGPKLQNDWIRLHFNNPICKEYETSKQYKHIPGWVLISDNHIVGMIFNILSKYTWNNKIYFAVTAHSFLVRPQFRAHSISLLMNFLKQKTPALILNTTTNEDVSEIFSKLKFQKSFTPDYDHSLAWVTHFSNFIVSFSLYSQKPVFKYLKYPFGLIDFIKQKKFKLPVQYETLQSFNQRFDDYWNRLKDTSDFYAFRSSEILNWHFKEKINNNEILIIIEKNSENQILSYSVFIHENNKKFNLSRMRLADYSDISKKYTSIKDMILYAKSYCTDNDISMLEVVGMDSEIRKSIIGLHPIRRKLPAWMFYFKPNHSDLNDLEFAKNWNSNSYDGDGSL